MRQVKDPRQTALFDTFKSILSPCALRTLDEGWQGVFRHVILELMPVDAIGQRFHPVLGAPSKELYSMCGLILIMEFKDWTQGEAAQAYMFNADVQYALNLEPAHQTMCARTIQRYQKLLVEDDLAGSIMAAVTTRLVELLEIDTSRQRLDSTHVLADMALFGRTRLMGVTIKRFLTQVKRHDRDAYEALPQAVRERYTPSKAGLFANVAKDGESRRRLRLDVARDMHWLIERFDCEESMTARQTYKTPATELRRQAARGLGRSAAKAVLGHHSPAQSPQRRLRRSIIAEKASTAVERADFTAFSAMKRRIACVPAACRMFQPHTFMTILWKTRGRPLARTRPSPVRRFRPLLVPSIPARIR
jgi:hypothetical protein